ncbi:hypothetical protein L798_01690 [Zootermopsis nevadensis]|uniref:Uncharacterized protein n=1 Tax=Zootermopsis nevadensis TaxID=136037 RepID=A0A067RES2_ZOONE|nr:hypothetical protein L798_01690 [Zootermopsis nevadensis]
MRLKSGSVASCIENTQASVVAAHSMSLRARSAMLFIGCSYLGTVRTEASPPL